MPEGPELHMAARFINQVNNRHKFGGKIVKSEVSTKNPDVDFKAASYTIKGESRGKELKVFLTECGGGKKAKETHILFRFGMSGSFKFTTEEDLPKHAHLRFFTIGEKPRQVLSFVDYRRFGRWEIEGEWGKDRGPDPMFDYDNFRQNVLDNLEAATFNKPICETMLDQKYFNGIGNYLRAEILFRANVKPFSQAREVLEGLSEKCDDKGDPDLLLLCNIVTLEVLKLDKGKNYDPQETDQSFSSWLQCYYVDGMKNLKDGNGRTIWFSGEPGPLVPKNARAVGRKGGTSYKFPKSGRDTGSGSKKIKSENDDDENSISIKEEAEDETESKRPKRSGSKKSKPVKSEKASDENSIPIKKEDEDETESKRPKRSGSKKSKPVSDDVKSEKANDENSIPVKVEGETESKRPKRTRKAKK